MVKRYRRKVGRSFYFLLCFLVVLAAVIISIGYSAMNQALDVDSISVKVRANADIRVTGVSVNGSSSGAVANWEDFDVHNINSSFDLPNRDSSITYKVTVTNIGNVEMGIFDIQGLPSNLEYSISEYELRTPLCDDDGCVLGVKKDFYITIKYKEDGYDSNKLSYTMILDFDFRSFVAVVYSDFLVSTDVFPSKVMVGDSLRIDFSSVLSNGNIEVYSKNTLIPYSYENFVLIVNDINNDIEIKFIPSVTKTPFLEFMMNQSLGSDIDIDFSDANIVSGVYLHDESKNDAYPIYYYRGEVSNNAIYAGYCWKIVRTTEFGGVKLIYNGELKDGKCVSTHDYLGSETFNDKISIDGKTYASPHQVGYKYEKTNAIMMIVPSKIADVNGVLTVGTIFGHDVKYDNSTKSYTLEKTKTITDLDEVEDDIRGGTWNSGYHYTCLTHSDTCSQVYYIYFNDYGNSNDERATGLFGILLTDGLNVTDSLDEMLYKSSNSIDSHAKSYLDEFFKGNGSDFVRAGGDALINHKDELDDVQWCNDRTIAGYHGWDISADNHLSDNKYLHFSAFGRLVGDAGVVDRSRPDLSCDVFNDAFTVNSSNGNGDLSYPIGMLTADEAVLAGAIYEKVTNTYLKMVASKNQFFMTPYYISDDHIRMFSLSTSGELSSSYASNSNAIRPAIAVKNNLKILGGDGTTSSPYVIGK